jgi:hypothetical protein
MNFVKKASIVSTFALMTAVTAGLASAQETYGDKSGYCAKNPDRCGSQEMQKPDGYTGEEDQGYTKKRRIQVDEDEGQATTQQYEQPRRSSQSDWQFDPKKHRRHRHRSDDFRFEFGGYWYPEPYWSYGIGWYRLGCDEGRAIVRNRGFYRVRPVECSGRAYTYLGRRHGETFQVIVSARSGRIIDINPI